MHSAEDASWVAMSSEAATWEGSLSSKAWRLLERHLDRHDRDVGQRYRLVVLERTLALNRGGKVPSFLTEHVKRHDLPALLRTLIKYDRLDEAFVFSLEALKVRAATEHSNAPADIPRTVCPVAFHSFLDNRAVVIVRPAPIPSLWRLGISVGRRSQAAAG